MKTRSPLWARLYAAHDRRLPNHPGKRTMQRLLLRLVVRGGARPFPWRVRNGAVLALTPLEGFAPYWTVGWTCLLTGVWEPHVERCIREVLRPGDRAVDVGANLGYFATAMAQAVGPEGRVWAFEPVPATFERLDLARELNGFHQLETRRLALGRSAGFATIAYDPRLSGNASLYRQGEPDAEGVEIEVVVLDELVEADMVEPPQLLKLEVEGHELEVLHGARETISRSLPAIIFELNQPLSERAGWSLVDIWELLRECGPYRFWLIEEDGLRPLDSPSFELAPGDYVDVLARADGPVDVQDDLG